ncbi:hypothetical protein [Spirosoma spitsbergense]|uniref:hypothetical protein n=1 Tax=Spirosoma spitsbergense TaxID=431554 RepID=UPI0012F7C36C|nr:hypothetical protein [Spirosoma spitsbergense]
MNRLTAKLLLIMIAGLHIGCSSARHTFKNYYGALIDKNYPRAASYLSDSCKIKLAKLRPDMDINQTVQIAFYSNLKSYEIGQLQHVGDSLLLAMKVTTTDGEVHIFDKDQGGSTVSGGNRDNGKRMVYDSRYRLYRVGGHWKIDTPYCRNFR